MTTDRKVTLFYSPQTRATGIAILLEELGAPYDLHVLNMKKGEQRDPAYLAINPLGKVPAVKHGDAIITEQVALFIYLADLFPEAGITPAIGDPLRGPYLRWLVYYAASFEPAVVDRALKREIAPQGVSPYGDFDSMLKVITDQLAKGPYILGDRFTAADVLWGTALGWTTSFKLVPELPIIMDYVKRLAARPAPTRVHERDAALAAQRDAAVAAG